MIRTIRSLSPAETATLIEWAAAEGWNPGLHDAAAFHAADPGGFFGAFVGSQMVAGISAIAYDAQFGFIGLYICHPDWRGQGHGKAVWDAGMHYLGARTIGLDGVPEQQANYASMGFVADYATVRMSGALHADKAPLPEAELDEVAALDRLCFPAARDRFLQHWLGPKHRSMIHREGDYAVLRQCTDGYKIGPLFASNIGVATEILATISGAVHIDVPVRQTAWLEALAQSGFLPGFQTSRMYRGTPPNLSLEQVFGITSLELG